MAIKTLVILGDGMGDFPCEALDGKTPLQAAAMPTTRKLAAAGKVVMIRTAPEGIYPGSDVCNLGLLGYHPGENYTGRAPIEAAGGHIPMAPNQVAFRCNLVTVQNDTMLDHSSGHISDAEAAELITAVKDELGGNGKVFHQGVSYRHILLWDDGPADAITQAPHEILDKSTDGYLPHGSGGEAVAELMEASRAIFADHPVNKARIATGKNPATQIWLWGQGKALTLEPYATRYGRSGGIVTAVDLVRGLGVLTGLDVPRVEGATGFTDTNYAGKVEATLALLEDGDFAYCHIEAPDECGHLGDPIQKRDAISDLDLKVVTPLLAGLEAKGEPYRLIITMDHRTPCILRGHSPDPVPAIIIEGPVGPLGDDAPQADFDEFVNGGEAQENSWEWMDGLLGE